jgi:hypothetical protein
MYSTSRFQYKRSCAKKQMLGTICNNNTTFLRCNDVNAFHEMASSSSSSNISTAMKRSNWIRNSRGSKLQYANHYSGSSSINNLGYLEGQSGGSGTSIRNKFV